MMIEQLITSGAITAVILAAMVLEGMVIGFLMLRRRSVSRFREYAAGLAAGAFLVLALRAALAGSGWHYIAVFLSLSLLAHFAEIILRVIHAGSTDDRSHPDA